MSKRFGERSNVCVPVEEDTVRLRAFGRGVVAMFEVDGVGAVPSIKSGKLNAEQERTLLTHSRR